MRRGPPPAAACYLNPCVLLDPLQLCPCGELCSNRSLHLLRPPKTEVFRTENRGWGVRAMEPVTKVGSTPLIVVSSCCCRTSRRPFLLAGCVGIGEGVVCGPSSWPGPRAAARLPQ